LVYKSIIAWQANQFIAEVKVGWENAPGKWWGLGSVGTISANMDNSTKKLAHIAFILIFLLSFLFLFLFILIFILFICAYNVWVISPPSSCPSLTLPLNLFYYGKF
jgi:hypothetical protein